MSPKPWNSARLKGLPSGSQTRPRASLLSLWELSGVKFCPVFGVSCFAKNDSSRESKGPISGNMPKSEQRVRPNNSQSDKLALCNLPEPLVQAGQKLGFLRDLVKFWARQFR